MTEITVTFSGEQAEAVLLKLSPGFGETLTTAEERLAAEGRHAIAEKVVELHGFDHGHLRKVWEGSE